MGVTGLWRLIEPAGKPVPVETLENKVLAVDISIWLHQMVKGYQDAKGAPLPNAHLMGLFQRLCKLLYFRIKPVFVFDGGFPDLKKETIAKRQDNKTKYNSESERLKRELALILGKKTAVSSLLGKQISPKGNNAASTSNDDDIFKLPALPQNDQENESESEDEESSSGSTVDLHSIDIESENFKSLSVKEKYDLLLELKETRKMNSWGKLHELPKKSDNFSDFQMNRLLKRRKVQECLEETEKEMGDTGMSLNDLESLLNEEGIDTKIDSLPTRRIASNDTTRFLLINNVKKALAEAKKKKEEIQPSSSKINEEFISKSNISTEDENEDLEKAIKMSLECDNAIDVKEKPKRDELEEDLEKAIKMSLESGNETDTNTGASKTDDSWTSVMTDTDYSDSEEEDGFQQPDNMSSAKAYIMQYSDFTHNTIDRIIAPNIAVKCKSKIPKVDKIIDELNREKSVILDKIDLSSSDDDCIEDTTNSPIEEVDIQKHGVVELNTSEDLESSVNNDEKDTTQSSVICIDDPIPDIVLLDTSADDDVNQFVEKNEKNLKSNKESSDSDDDFEEVPDVDSKSTKTVVELTLNVDDAPDEDIFADIFDNEKDISENITADINITKNFKEKQTTAMEDPAKKDDALIEKGISRLAERNSDKVNTDFHSDRNKIIPKNLETKSLIENENSTETDVGNKMAIDTLNAVEKENHESQTSSKEINKSPMKPISTEKLNSMVEELQSEEQNLLQEKGRLDRIGRNITEQMTKEAQELLQIFGIPYVVAPMEAEAQCAFLENVKLTDGTITDDSDIWLFGGRTVYKNFFNQKKHVLQFLAERVERSFNLSREQLILLALLVGSDYTTGVTGVGPVTALEILASFPFNKKQFFNETSKQGRYAQIITGLQEFKKWVRGGKRTDNTTLKKKLKNVDLTDDFPSVRVVQAYLEPNIEKSEEKFTWGELDVSVLRDYTKTKFGWSQNKLDEIIKPVLKRILDRKSQKSVQDYFKRKIDFQSLEEQMSKRVKAAVQRMGPEAPIDDQSMATDHKGKSVRKRKIQKDNETEISKAAGSLKIKQKKSNEETVLNNHNVKVVSHTQDGTSGIEIIIPKSDRVQEIIPQREKDKQNLLQNKMKAIEIFRKTKIDRKRKVPRKRPNLPKEKAELSESSDSN